MSTPVPREKAVFVEALDIADPDQRRQILDQACGTDHALRERVEKLLALSQGAGDFFEACAPALAPAAADAVEVLAAAESGLEPELPETRRIGPYKLLEPLGEGGYGVVYMAEQEQPIRRRVALKIIKLGMDTKHVIARFEAERQALALMDHPNIARVLDAGATEAGRPYFVMELVYGVKLTEYCDQNRVSMRERLELFIEVCQAVQHAHQKGIIHRDLKPSNIMVTMHDGVPVPKVIDFGIAKATGQRLTDKTLYTSYAQLLGPPAYMSPEQMELSGLNLDTRSDIYALGVLLYELLTGRTPFDTTDLLKAGLDELRRTVREQEPLSPSAKLRTLNPEELTKTAKRRHLEPPRLLTQLRGDLDWIVLKCLEKDRTRRYATAAALAEDIEHYLHDEAVRARPPSRWYRLRKLVRRNRLVFLFGTVAVAALLVGTATSTLMFLSEARLRKVAQLREEASRVALLVTQRRFEEADKLLASVPLKTPSLEVAAGLRALGDWHATHGRWHQAAERLDVLVQVNQLDEPGVAALDQLRLGAALLETGDRRRYEQWRLTMATNAAAAEAFLPNPVLKVCLLLPAGSDLLEPLVAASELDTTRSAGAAGKQHNGRPTVLSSETRSLLDYRLGAFAKVRQRKSLTPIQAPLATIALLRAMATWQSRDYWGAMVEWTKGYAVIQAGARQGLLRLPMRSEVFPGTGDPDYLQAAWYDWAVAGLLLREWDEMLGDAERSWQSAEGTPSLEQLALVRALGEWHALRAEWSDARRCSEFCLQFNQADSLDHASMDYVNAATACLQLGDTNAYARLREEMALRFNDPDDTTAERTLAVALMQPLDDRVTARLEPLAAWLDRVVARGNEPPSFLLSLGLLGYRRGDYAKALEWSHRSLSKFSDVAQPSALAHVILAMSLQQLGDPSAAHRELERARFLVETGFDLEFDMWWWRYWVLVRLLLQEADSLIPRPDG